MRLNGMKWVNWINGINWANGLNWVNKVKTCYSVIVDDNVEKERDRQTA